MFAYCGNNPTNNIDAAGRLLKKIGVSIEMFLIALNGDGSDQYFTDGSKLVRALKKSKIMKEEIEANIETYKLSGKSELTISGSVSLYGKDNRFDYDLSFSVGKANYSMSISQETRTIGFWFFKTEQTRTVTIIEVYDTYDFDEYRDDNSFGSQLNNLGYSWQEEGLLKPYKWSAVYTIYGKWE